MADSQRSDELELIDLGSHYFTREEYEDWLIQMSRCGKLTGGDRATFRAFKRLSRPPQSILDVGCGGGNFTLLLAQRYPEANILGIDTSAMAIAYAKQLLERNPGAFPRVSFQHLQEPRLGQSFKDFDVITATLVCHHLNDSDLIDFFKQATTLAKQAVIINDLHRHPLASVFFFLVAPLFFRNRLFLTDGPISIRRAFKRRDWKRLLHRAGIGKNQWTLTWHWLFRWTVTMRH